METKRCSKCAKEFSISNFYQRTNAKSYHSACKSCEKSMAKDWYQRNKEKANLKVRKWRDENSDAIKQYRADNRQKHYRQEVVRKYKIEPLWFDEQINRQNNSCLCCNQQFKWGNKQTTPHVDHCHLTKKIRGILCNRCNTVLGLCGDNKELIQKLTGYLECHG